jgi:hypothetical protein
MGLAIPSKHLRNRKRQTRKQSCQSLSRRTLFDDRESYLGGFELLSHVPR